MPINNNNPLGSSVGIGVVGPWVSGLISSFNGWSTAPVIAAATLNVLSGV